MNTKILNTFVVLMLIGTISCSSLTMDRLNNLKVKSDLSKQVIEVVQIQLAATAQGSVDVAIRMVEGLASGLVAQQAKSDAEHTQKNNAWRKLIAQYRANIKAAQAKIRVLEKEIAKLEAEIKATLRKIAVDKKQIELVTKKIEQLEEARRVDVAAQQKRTKRQEEMLKAVNWIIGQLDALLKTGSFVQLNDIKQQLQELVKSNPIEALVQLTMTFNQQSVKFAITKLASIRDALVTSLKDEVVQDAEAKNAFERLLHELNGFLTVSRADLEKQQGHLASLRKQLAAKQQDLKETQSILARNQALLQATIRARDAYNKQYESDKVDRRHEGEVIQLVVQILKKHVNATDRAESNHNTRK